MQQLSVKLKNVPGDASQVPCSIRPWLNREETLSAVDKVLAYNNLDGNRQQHRAGRNLRVSDVVYVINMRGDPLMPTKHKKAKILLKENKAKVVKRLPFTIQLTMATGETKQKITIGVDSGAKNIGISAVSDKQELISGEVYLDDRMSKRLADRKMYRRNKRDRLWYREPRFNNRKRAENWLPPSVERRYRTHLNGISRIKKILPISNVIVEVGNFDIQKLNDPMIQGTGYQQGDMYQYKNRIAYLIAREKGVCQYCNKGYKKGDPWRLHHVWGKQKDRPEDWALLHKGCHIRLHELKEENILRKKKSKSYKSSTFMNIIKGRFAHDIDCKLVFGYETFVDRCNLGLGKSHINDAFVIAGGGEQKRIMSFEITQHRKNNRSLQKNRKGFAPSIRKQRYPIRPNDLVKIGSKWMETNGVHCRGTRIRINKESMSIKQIKDVFHTETLSWRMINFSSVNKLKKEEEQK